MKAILFDLDDTLFDHRFSSRSGLARLQQDFPALQQEGLDRLEQRHLALLNELHLQVLQGRLSLEAARLERMRRLLAYYGESASAERAQAAAGQYRLAYDATRRPVPGAVPLLQTLHGKVRIGVVTNNLVAEQVAKLRRCGLDGLVDVLVVSEEVGVTKPHPRIFETALARLAAGPVEAVMVGDSWEADVLGAYGVGIRAIWLNRYGVSCPDPALAVPIPALEPLEPVLKLLLQGA